MIIDQDGGVIVSNDGATIIKNLNIEHPIAKLLVELSLSQDDEIGDGTTAVVILVGALLEGALKLLDKGLHPHQIIEGYDKACKYALDNLEEIKFDKNNNDELKNSAKNCLCSKVVSKYQDKFAEIAVNAVLAVADLSRKDVNLDLIKLVGKVGGSLEDTQLIEGIVLDKEMSHPQMPKKVTDASICILNIPFEPPKPKSKYNIDIKSVEDYKKLYQKEQNYFKDMVDTVKKSGANFVICRWGFDDEANHLLMRNNLPAVRWVEGTELEQIALASGGRIINNFKDIAVEKFGKAYEVKEVNIGTKNDKVIVIELCLAKKAVTILVRGSSSMIVEEAKRSIHDALCVVRNMIKDPKIVYGGGAAEISCSLYVAEKADNIPTIQQYAIRAFAEALDIIPLLLAENSGYNGIEYLANLKSKQKIEKNPCLGVDCMKKGTFNMMRQEVYEGYNSKKKQIELATQICKMILKIDEIIKPHKINEPSF